MAIRRFHSTKILSGPGGSSASDARLPPVFSKEDRMLKDDKISVKVKAIIDGDLGRFKELGLPTPVASIEVLRYAVLYGREDIVEWLAREGMGDLNFALTHAKTPSMAKLLIRLGATNFTKPPIYAKVTGNAEMVKFWRERTGIVCGTKDGRSFVLPSQFSNGPITRSQTRTGLGDFEDFYPM